MVMLVNKERINISCFFRLYATYQNQLVSVYLSEKKFDIWNEKSLRPK